MIWTQKMIAEWAESQFGYHGPRPIAIRGNKEMAELISSLENNIPAKECAEECADVAIFLLQVCERLGFDLLDLVDQKMEINIGRTWTIGSDGSHQHVDDAPPAQVDKKPFTVINGHHLDKGIAKCTLCGDTDYTFTCPGF